MIQTELNYPTEADLRELELEVLRLRAEATREIARAVVAFVARIFKAPFAQQQSA
ncbi:MAG: hypothetical protein MJH10_08785 [Epibacterium sp.]|nr:hypothetical protein [Epibacterium sp.]NQX73629.1 hypothetical protein [Epibacterium sp.]